MGSRDVDADAAPDEKPQHNVSVATFCMSKTETMVAQYQLCEAAGACKRPLPPSAWDGISGDEAKFWIQLCNSGQSDRTLHPINCVDWPMADIYCRWSGGRLPTEEEWEYAARGRSGGKYPWGSEPPDETRLNACGSECRRLGNKIGKNWSTMHSSDDGWSSTAPVGSYPKGATSDGLLDMAGNVWEWTASRYCPYSGGGCTDTHRAVRGGTWFFSDPSRVRVTYRNRYSPSELNVYVGFRCARTP
jgi:formylglycine-generating enzyme required for sulfatase activity